MKKTCTNWVHIEKEYIYINRIFDIEFYKLLDLIFKAWMLIAMIIVLYQFTVKDFSNIITVSLPYELPITWILYLIS